eukprot:scaffold246415_cov27-Tisochrysis_lutea.AAC.1
MLAAVAPIRSRRIKVSVSTHMDAGSGHRQAYGLASGSECGALLANLLDRCFLSGKALQWPSVRCGKYCSQRMAQVVGSRHGKDVLAVQGGARDETFLRVRKRSSNRFLLAYLLAFKRGIASAHVKRPVKYLWRVASALAFRHTLLGCLIALSSTAIFIHMGAAM